MAAAAILDNFEWPYLRNGSRSTYIARIARSSLRSFLVKIWILVESVLLYQSTKFHQNRIKPISHWDMLKLRFSY